MKLAKFEAGKEYVTRGGGRARVYAVDGAGPYPIHGAILKDSGAYWSSVSWTESGSYYSGWGQCPEDILPNPEVFYLNIYRNGSAELYRTREEAAECFREDTISCVKVKFKEGQFDV